MGEHETVSDEDLLRDAKSLAEEVLQIEAWVDDNAGAYLPRRQARKLLAALAERAKAAHEREREERRTKRAAASSLSEVAACIIEDHDPDSLHTISVDEYDDGLSAVTNGSCLLLARLPGVALRPRPMTVKVIRRTASLCDAYEARTVTSEALASWAAACAERVEKRVGLIRGVPFDVSLVEEWAIACADVAPGPVIVRAGGGTQDPVSFAGDGWTTILMPVRLAETDLEGLSELDLGAP